MLSAADHLIELVNRCPHGDGVNETCSLAGVTIAAAGGSSSAAVNIPYWGNANVAAPVNYPTLCRLYIIADQGIDIHVRFGIAVGAAIVTDYLISAGQWRDFSCYRAIETQFRVFANVAVGGNRACSYYVSGIYSQIAQFL